LVAELPPLVIGRADRSTGWLLPVALPLIWAAFFASLIRQQRLSMILPGSLILSGGIGVFIGINRVSGSRLAAATRHCADYLLTRVVVNRRRDTLCWRKHCPLGAYSRRGDFSVGANFFWGDLSLLSSVLFLSVGFGLVLLLTGIYTRLLGLILAGSLLATTGAGVYFGWNQSAGPNALAQTGIMLAWFSLGWILLTVIYRALFHKFMWWPLIPGGILAMVGWGLYIGGNPGNALSFIGNTGSIGLIVFGIYLLLMRRGFHQ